MVNKPLRISIIVPCLNEELAIGVVVADLRRTLPQARIVVVDNGSTDATAARAMAAGAEVIYEPRQGKGYAIATAFASIDDDLAIMIDGDASYPAEGARLLLVAYQTQPADMITGIRTASSTADVYRPLHRAGSSAFAAVFKVVFHHAPGDLFSGLRLFSRRFYKNVPILFRGFELEAELTVQAVDKGFSVYEVLVPFGERAMGSVSKLHTLRDGLRILRLVTVLFRDYRPLLFFGAISFSLFCAGLAAGSLPIYEYLETRMVGRFPLAILAAALMNLSLFTLLTGLMLQSSRRHHREAYQIALRNFS